MNTYLEIAIALILIILIFSVITYVIQELIAANLRLRGKMLWKSLAQLLDNQVTPGRLTVRTLLPGNYVTPLTNELFNHGEIQSLHRDLMTLPSYIPSSNFALAIMDIIAGKAPVRTSNLFVDFANGLKTLHPENGNLPQVLKNLSDTSSDLKDLQNKIEKWFNNYMDRVSGWYQSHTVVTVRLIAIGVTLSFNLNMIKIAREVASNSVLRTNLVTIAQQVTSHPETINLANAENYHHQIDEIETRYKKVMDSTNSDQAKQDLYARKISEEDTAAARFNYRSMGMLDTLTSQLSTLNIPVGWTKAEMRKDFLNPGGGLDFTSTFLVLAGWLIAAGCISMGAPFWFNILMQLVNVRRAGVKPDGKDKKK